MLKKVILTRGIHTAGGSFDKGTILEVVECPEEYKDKFNYDVWVQGTTEPIRLLPYEYLSVEKEETDIGKDITISIRKNFFENIEKSKEIFSSLLENVENKEEFKDVYFDIIKGKKEFKTNGKEIELIDKKDEVQEEMLRNYCKQIFKHNNRFFVQKELVLDYGINDIDTRINFCINENSYYGKRASHYVKDKTEIVVEVIVYNVKSCVIMKEINFDEELSEYTSTNPQEAIKENYIASTGHFDTYGIEGTINKFKEKKEEEDYKEELEKYKKEILKRSPVFEYEYKGVILKIPEYPFKKWIKQFDLESKEPENEEVEKYKSVCPSGMKLKNDDPMHTDWLVGAGIQPENYNDFYSDFISIYLSRKRNSFNILNKQKNQNNRIYVKVPFDLNKDKFEEEDLLEIFDKTKEGGLVLTKNATLAAHIVNNAMELNFSIIQLNKEIKENFVYEFNIEDKTVNKIGECNIQREIKKGKAGLLNYLYKNGINVPDGIYLTEEKSIYLKHDDLYIFRSSGENEGEEIMASGIFKSVLKKGINSKEGIKEVLNSFNSPLANAYMERINKKIKPGILIQPFLKSEFSVVIKKINNEKNISYIKGPCSLIVDGSELVKTGSCEETKEFEKLFEKIEKLIEGNLECEFIKNKGTIYCVQATKIREK